MTRALLGAAPATAASAVRWADLTAPNISGLAASATTDATNASNITSGSLSTSRIQAIAANSILGNNTAAARVMIQLTAAQVLAMLFGSPGLSVAAPAGAATLTVAGTAGYSPLILNSASTGSTADALINRASTTANAVGQGANVSLVDTGANTQTIWQQAGGQTELWQYNGAWGQVLKVTTARGVVINAPSSGVTLTVTAAAAAGSAAFQVNQAATGSSTPFRVTGNTVANSSYGVIIQAGTNGADAPLRIYNAAGSVLQWQFFGDGGVVGNAATNGDQGAGTINVSGAYYVQGVKQAIWAAAAAGWGAPTGAALVANFSGSAATLAQCSSVIAQLITLLETAGVLAA